MQPAWPYSGPGRAALAALFSPIFIIKINDIISDLILFLHSWRKSLGARLTFTEKM